VQGLNEALQMLLEDEVEIFERKVCSNSMQRWHLICLVTGSACKECNRPSNAEFRATSFVYHIFLCMENCNANEANIGKLIDELQFLHKLYCFH
jgi:hypothetical protein